MMRVAVVVPQVSRWRKIIANPRSQLDANSEYAGRVDNLKKADPKRIGPFSVIARLGSGGMGTVYLATRDGASVALKVVSRAFDENPELKSRFVREIQNLKKTRSPFIAGILDSKVETDAAWLAVDFVNGSTVAQEVNQRGPLSNQRLWELTISSLLALSQIHSRGIVHRDIKPANIILSDTGPKIIDFGISQTSDDTSLTTTGLVAGSPAWLAPEQLDLGDVSSAADIFSLGSLVVFADSARSPWGDQATMSVPILFNKILSESPDLSALTPELRNVISQALAKDPAERPSAEKLLSTSVKAAPPEALHRVLNYLQLGGVDRAKPTNIDPQIAELIAKIDERLSPAFSANWATEKSADETNLLGLQSRMTDRLLEKPQRNFGVSTIALFSGLALAIGALVTTIAVPFSDTVEAEPSELDEKSVVPEPVEPPRYVFTTVSDSGIATLNPGDGSEVLPGEGFDITLSFAEPMVFEDDSRPELTVVGPNSDESGNSCLGVQEFQAGGTDRQSFEARCEGLAEGQYIIRAVWAANNVAADTESFERETITALVNVRERAVPQISDSGPAPTPSGTLTYELIGGGWGTFDDAQYFSMQSNSLVRSWCLRPAPGLAWRDDNNWAQLLNPDGSLGERVASTVNQGGCTITGSANGMEDGNPGELRVIVVPGSVLAPRIVPDQCLMVRFTAGGSSFEPEFNDICVRG